MDRSALCPTENTLYLTLLQLNIALWHQLRVSWKFWKGWCFLLPYSFCLELRTRNPQIQQPSRNKEMIMFSFLFVCLFFCFFLIFFKFYFIFKLYKIVLVLQCFLIKESRAENRSLASKGTLSCSVRHMEKAMVPHSSTLAWKIPWMEEPGRLQSMGSLRVGQDWATSLSLFTFMHWRRKWQPTPAFLPGESQGRGSLVGCRLWGCTESDTTEAT